jgi:hypothetical protein
MMTDTISFRDIVKLIHPDVNPTIENASIKMTDAVKFRSNEGMLYQLGVLWGVITRNVEDDTTPRETWGERMARQQSEKLAREAEVKKEREAKERREYTRFRQANRIFQPGDRIYVRTRRCNVVITKVTSTRVYFTFNGKNTFAAKKNVRFTRASRV